MSDNQKMQWYTLHVYSSMEKSVVKALEERIARSELRDCFCRSNAFRKFATAASTRASAGCIRAMSSFRWR